MSSEYLACQKQEHVATIRINAAVSNRIEMARLSDELWFICSSIRLDSEIRVVVVTSSLGDAFSPGKNWIPDIPAADQTSETMPCALAEPIAVIPQPVIAGIRGNATGQGLEMILACDLRISTDKSLFGLPHIRQGSIPSDGGIQRLCRLVGRGKALEMILTGRTINAREAGRLGLVNRIVPDSELTDAVSSMAQKMAVNSPLAMNYAKESIYKGMDLTLAQGLRLEADLYFLLHTTRDRTEGIRAFREKRPAEFKGR